MHAGPARPPAASAPPAERPSAPPSAPRSAAPSAPGHVCDAASLIAWLQARRSVGPRGLGPPAPSLELLQAAAELAARAPDHQGLQPVRFVHVGPEARAALGELFAQAAREQGRDATGVADARARAHTGPALLAVVAQVRDDVPGVPPHEQWITVGAAVMGLLQALHLAGHAAKVLGGSAAQSQAVRRAFCHDGEQLACWVIAGTAQGDPPAPPAKARRDLLTDWEPPAPG